MRDKIGIKYAMKEQLWIKYDFFEDNFSQKNLGTEFIRHCGIEEEPCGKSQVLSQTVLVLALLVQTSW